MVNRERTTLSILFTAILLTALSLLAPRFAFGQAAAASVAAAGSQMAGSTASTAVGSQLVQTCDQTPQPPSCQVGMLSLLQGLSMLGNAGQSTDSATSTSSSIQTAPANGTLTLPTAGGSTGGGIAGMSASQLRKALADSGYKLSSDDSQITLPNGATIPTGALGTDAGMEAGGFSSAQIASTKAAIAAANRAVTNKFKSATQEGGGGGGSASGGVGRSAPSFNFAMPTHKRVKPDLSGMSKNFGTDKIGVAGDNIFDMITRRYKEDDAKNSFIKK